MMACGCSFRKRIRPTLFGNAELLRSESGERKWLSLLSLYFSCPLPGFAHAAPVTSKNAGSGVVRDNGLTLAPSGKESMRKCLLIEILYRNFLRAPSTPKKNAERFSFPNVFVPKGFRASEPRFADNFPSANPQKPRAQKGDFLDEENAV